MLSNNINFFYLLFFRTDSLREKFSHYGDIGDVYIPRNYSTNEPRGFAFVRFADKRDAEDAQRALDGAEIDGREIRIQEVRFNFFPHRLSKFLVQRHI